MGGGNGGQKSRGGWRERREQERGETAGKTPGDGREPGDKDPMPGGTAKGGPGGKENTPMAPGGSAKSGAPGDHPDGGGGTKSTPSLPFDDPVHKQVWGHLPERLRQQMSQYYKEQFMPSYGDLLQQYYSSLAERERTTKKP
ncbi:hypothetical protein [Fimbriiglobus ruber]|uniref:Uncharacterized protein n=1 Tax=Fimbriiglobus ruber TaxID=1908690 RepID=A0A225DM82_9BACT|nr:hypothetical protein [Fimbriiglobus ruber]OWK38319.1 hypothetical protein FRUB_07439 [Fimbriiglobus ruber]